MRGLCVAGLGLLALAGSARAGDLSVGLPTKAPPPAAPVSYDWTGYYLGAHLGYALGGSNWSATQAGAPGLSGSLDFSNAYNFSTGNGSYLLGLQAGYDAVSRRAGCLASRPTFRFRVSSAATRRSLRRRPGRRIIWSGSSSPATRGCGSVTHRAVGSITSPAASRSVTTNSPAPNSPAFRPAAARCPARWRTSIWCRASAASSAPASKSRWPRTGPRSSNICSPTTPVAASAFPRARSSSIPA